MSEYDPTKPAWDKSKPGALPAPLAAAFAASRKIAAEQIPFTELSFEERERLINEKKDEAIDLANSRSQGEMQPEQHFIWSWEREKRVAQGNLEAFSNPDNYVIQREEKLVITRLLLATALFKLGETAAAREMAAGFPDLLEQIERVQAAKERPDADLHNHACPRPRHTVEHGNRKVEIETDRRWATEQVFSEIHGKLVYVWECTECGELNATPDKPERQERYTDAMREAIHAAATKGETIIELEAGALLAVKP